MYFCSLYIQIFHELFFIGEVVPVLWTLLLHVAALFMRWCAHFYGSAG